MIEEKNMKVGLRNYELAHKLTHEMTRTRRMRCRKCGAFLSLQGLYRLRLRSDTSCVELPISLSLVCPYCQIPRRMDARFRRELERLLDIKKER